MMRIFNHLKVQVKINIGYAIILLVMLGISGISLVRLRQINTLVDHLSERLSLDQQLSHDITVQFLTVQSYARQYINYPNAEDLQRYTHAQNLLNYHLTQASQLIKEPERLALLREIQSLTGEYQYTFEAIQLLLDDRQITLGGRLEADAEQIASRLDALQASARQANAMETVLNIEATRVAFQTLRTDSLAYMIQGEDRHAQDFEAHYKAFLVTLATLKAGLPGQSQSELYNELDLASGDYYLAFRAVQADYNAQTELTNVTLKVLGDQIFSRASAIDSSITQELAAGQAQAQRMVKQTATMTAIAMLVTLLVGSGLSYGLSRHITGPLKMMVKAASRMAQGELEQSVMLQRTDELGELATAFNLMSAQLQRAFATLQANEYKYRQLFENSHDVIIIVAPTGALLDFNVATVQLTGYSREELSQQALEAFHIDRARYREFQELLEQHEAISNFEVQIRHKDGTIRDLVVNAARVRTQEGVLLGFQWVGHDITRRKQIETEQRLLLAQIQEQNQRIQLIINTVPEGVILLEAETATGWRVMLANPPGAEMLTALATFQEGEQLVALNGHPLAELLVPLPKGHWHDLATDAQYFQVTACALPPGNGPAGWVLVIRDLTEQRKLDQRLQQQERLAALGQLAAGIAHDFNNIMAVIVLYAQITARSQGLSPHDRERLQTINDQAQHATRLIQQILDFSRRAVIERRALDLELLLREQISLFKRTLPEHIEIRLLAGDEDYTIYADPTRIQQLLTNLALNARDAMPQGGTLTLELHRFTVTATDPAPLPEMQAGHWICLTVADTGHGIPPEVLPHIFEPFFTTKEPGKGSGLGLPQVYGIVGQHGGHIDVQSQPGQGTVFFIYLPALVAPPVAPAAPSPSPLVEGHQEKILVVEDDAAARQALVESLKTLNYQPLEAANGQIALQLLAQSGLTVALVLSDVVMPTLGGIGLLQALRDQHSPVKVLLLTGHPLDKEIEDLRTTGLDAQLAGWLLKPVDLAQLAETIARILKAGPP